MPKPEEILRDRVANYLQVNHTMIPYRIDLAADLKLTIGQATKHKALNGNWSKGYPDLFIATCRGGYGGLYVELKAGKKIPKDKHTHTQSIVHQILRNNGYKAEFSLNYDATIELIEEYLAL